MEDALQHDERDDQNADLEQDTGGIHRISQCDKTLSCSREGDALCSGGGCHVLITQVYQAAVERRGAAVEGQADNLGGDSD